MTSHREQFDDDGSGSEQPRSTRFATDTNRQAVTCGMCAEAWFVDDLTYDGLRRSAEFDPSSDPYCCDRCAAEIADEERGTG